VHFRPVRFILIVQGKTEKRTRSVFCGVSGDPLPLNGFVNFLIVPGDILDRAFALPRLG